MSNTSTDKSPKSKSDSRRLIIDEIGRDTQTGILGRGYSSDNGKTFHVLDTIYGRLYSSIDIDKIWNKGTSDRVKKEVDAATAEIPAVKSAADEAVKKADSAIASSKVNSDAIVAQSEAISEAKSAMDSATAEIQQTAANAASDAAKIRADVARVQNEVDTAKAANSASVEALKSDIDTAKQDLANVHGSLMKAQSAVEQNQKLINDSVAKISNDIVQDRKDIASAQQNNADLAKQLDDYSKQAEAQGKTIKSIQDKQDSFTATLADVQGNVSQVSDKVDGLSANLKDTQGNVATVKVQADQLNATLTDHAKSIATLTASAKELSSTLEDADGRLSKVEQTAQTNSSTLSDVQGDLSQVKQQADGLVTTLKDAQGNIDQLQQTAKGTAEQISDVQGDITSLQKDVNGIKLTIADHEKNIHTLQADSKTLKDDMADAKGNISSLKKTATSLDSEFKDHDGRLSKVEQTANTLTNEFSDQQGHLNRVEQTAQGTQQTVANQQGQINNIKTDAAGIHETITGQGNQIANINVTLNGLNTKYDGVSGDLSKLSDKVTTNSTQIDQDKKLIALKADQSTVNNLSGEVSQNSAQLKVQAGQISSKVSSEDFNTLDNKVGGAIAQIDKNATAIDQTNKQISLKADQTEVDKIKNTATQNSSRLDVMAGEIQSKVTSTDVDNIINGKGYATTSTVQSLITQKAGTINESITNLDAKYNTTVTQVQSLTASIDGLQSNVTNFKNDTSSQITQLSNAIQSKVGTADFDNLKRAVDMQTLDSADINNMKTNGHYFVHKLANNPVGGWVYVDVTGNGNDRIRQDVYQDNGNEHKYRRWVYDHWTNWDEGANYSKITQLSNLIQSKVGTADFDNLKRAVDMQTLDSADINNMKTNGHYFVHKLANNPVGGWVYVDVTGNGNDRIRQDVYQDNGNEHKYRRWVYDHWTNWDEGANYSEITQLRDDINLRVKSGDLITQINLEAGRALFQSKKIYMDADTVVMGPHTRAFIPSAAITSLEADKITTGTLNGIEIRQLETGGRSIDIKNGNIAIASNDPYEPRISFTNNGKDAKMFNAVGDIEVLNQEFALFNFTPEDTHSLNPIPFFKVTNTGQIGSGGAQLNMDHAIFDGYEWWTPSAGVTFGRTWNGVDKSSDYADIYAKSFVPHSELSAKTRIKKLDRKEALDKIMQDDMYTYQFKEDVRDGVSKRYASFIIDNIHDVAQYTEPEEFLSANGKGRDDGTQLAYLIAAVQYQQEQIEELKKKLEEK